ncbi:MAG: ribonuclease Z [Candidatus Micrarchaeia archaeon]
MTKVIALGTSGSTPTKERQLPSFAVIYNGDVLLFDCGEGTQMQLMRFGINISKIKAIFISHAHGDHIIGIAGLVRTMSMAARQDPLPIFVPKGYEHIIENLLVFDKAIIRFKVQVKGVKQGVVYASKFYKVIAFRLNHSIPTYGYVFKENDKRHFLKQKADKYGIKGPMFSLIQRKGWIKLGPKIVRISELTRLELGKKIVYATDTRPTKNTVKFAKDADLLIHEAAYTESEHKLATERKHATAMEAANIAKEAKVKMLLLTHISARHRDAGILEKEARKIFRNTKLAYDGMSIDIK